VDTSKNIISFQRRSYTLRVNLLADIVRFTLWTTFTDYRTVYLIFGTRRFSLLDVVYSLFLVWLWKTKLATGQLVIKIIQPYHIFCLECFDAVGWATGRA